MLQNPNAPQSGNSTGLVMGGINLTCYPGEILSEIAEDFRDTERTFTFIFEDGHKDVIKLNAPREVKT